MAHSLCRVYVHFVWTTKNVQRILISSARPRVHKHLFENARENSIFVETLNIQPEHVHLLIKLSQRQTVEDVAKMLKGESSHWINLHNIIEPKFAWQTGYGAFSVSYTHYKDVVAYINNQDEHHKRVSFIEEYKTLLRKYGFTETETDESVFSG